MTSLSTLPAFAAYFALSLGLLALFLVIYTQLTPQREWTLIRDGNVAAALALVGAAIGFCLPLASTVAHSVGLLDVLVWGVVALVVQVLAFLLLRLLLGNVGEAIARGNMACAVMLAGGSVAIGLLNAACLSY